MKCKTCRGTGQKMISTHKALEFIEISCPTCKGTGKQPEEEVSPKEEFEEALKNAPTIENSYIVNPDLGYPEEEVLKPGKMTKAEALIAMEEGYKVTREYFGSGEYLYIYKGELKSEDGYMFEDWWDTIEPTLSKTSDTAWTIFKEKTN